MPRLADFQLSHPGVIVELETDHRGVDPAQRDFDIWIAYVGETAAPRPQGLFEEALYEEDLLPVCSPTLVEARGRPGDPGDRQVAAPARCCLITTADSRRNPEVRAFREWILKEA